MIWRTGVGIAPTIDSLGDYTIVCWLESLRQHGLIGGSTGTVVLLMSTLPISKGVVLKVDTPTERHYCYGSKAYGKTLLGL